MLKNSTSENEMLHLLLYGYNKRHLSQTGQSY